MKLFFIVFLCGALSVEAQVVDLTFERDEVPLETIVRLCMEIHEIAGGQGGLQEQDRLVVIDKLIDLHESVVKLRGCPQVPLVEDQPYVRYWFDQAVRDVDSRNLFSEVSLKRLVERCARHIFS